MEGPRSNDLPYLTWQASALPLCYGPIKLVRTVGFEPTLFLVRSQVPSPLGDVRVIFSRAFLSYHPDACLAL